MSSDFTGDSQIFCNIVEMHYLINSKNINKTLKILKFIKSINDNEKDH